MRWCSRFDKERKGFPQFGRTVGFDIVRLGEGDPFTAPLEEIVCRSCHGVFP